MLSKIVLPGDRIEITAPVSQEKKKMLEEENSIYAKALISQVYDIIDESSMKIAMPIVEGRVIPLPLNRRFDICVFTSGGLYKGRIVVTERYKENGLYVLVVELMDELKKFQRRQYYRLEFTKDIEYLLVNPSMLQTSEEEKEDSSEQAERKIDQTEQFLWDDLIEENPSRKGIIVDLSGGGVRFASAEKLERGNIILIKLDVVIATGKQVYSVLGKVLYSNRMLNNDRMYEQRIEFFELGNIEREIIIRYIFEQERRMRQGK